MPVAGRIAAKRDANEKEIVTTLRELGASVQPLNIKGAPDLLIGVAGLNMLGEVKSESGKLTTDQETWHCGWAGSPVYILRSPEDAVRLVEDARQQRGFLFIKPLLTTILDPCLYPGYQSNDRTSEWRAFLKEVLLQKRKFASDLSGKSLERFGCHMHEGIIPRAVVPASIKWSWRIHCEYNIFLLTPDEHIPNPPSRSWCYGLACERYGKDVIDAWIESLPFKTPPDRAWLKA